MVKLTQVFKEYPIDGEILTALGGVTLEITKGEFTAIFGPSGSGKSTLMHIMGLLDQPTRGKVTINGEDISEKSDSQLSTLRNRFVGFVFQQFNLINKLTVLENILLPTVYNRSGLTFNPSERAGYLMERFGIANKKGSYPNRISGGQQQRTAIARALVMNPQLVLADEPTGNLDTKTGSEIMKLISELNRTDRLTVVIVTHEREIAKYARRKIYLRDGRIQTHA